MIVSPSDDQAISRDEVTLLSPSPLVASAPSVIVAVTVNVPYSPSDGIDDMPMYKTGALPPAPEDTALRLLKSSAFFGAMLRTPPATLGTKDIVVPSPRPSV